MLSVRGEIDLATAPALRERLLPVLERGSAPLVLDLSEVAFMDSSGVHLLVEAYRRLRAQNRRLAIVCPEHSQVHRLLALVGMLDLLTVYHSRESALTGGDELVRPQSGPNRRLRRRRQRAAWPSSTRRSEMHSS